MDVKDIAWVAGLLEGEGCFSMHRGYPMISLEMTDEDVVRRYAALFPTRRNAKVMERPNAYHCQPGCDMSKHKDSWRYQIQGSKAVQVMYTVYPLMGKRRQGKIREILLRWRDNHYYENSDYYDFIKRPGSRLEA